MNDSIFGNLADVGTQILSIDLALITPDPDQPRKAFDDEEIAELASSIDEHGLLQPIIVRDSDQERGKYIIIAGERRWRAHEHLKRPSIDAIVRGEKNAAAVSIIENMQRVDLNPLETADAIDRLMQLEDLNQVQVAKLLGTSRISINKHLKLRSLPDAIRNDAAAASMSKTHLIELAAIEGEDLQLATWALIKDGQLSISGIRNARQTGKVKPAASKKAGSGSKLSPVDAAFLKISGGIATLKAKDLSAGDRRQIEEFVTNLNDILTN